jgi:hypothetical protein
MFSKIAIGLPEHYGTMASESTMISKILQEEKRAPSLQVAGIAAFAQCKSCRSDQLKPELCWLAEVMCIFCEQISQVGNLRQVIRADGEKTKHCCDLLRSGSGSFRCRYLVTFRRVPVKMLGEVPVGSDDNGW